MESWTATDLLIKADEILDWFHGVKLSRKYYGQLYNIDDYLYDEWEQDYKSRADLIRHVEKKQEILDILHRIFGNDIPSAKNIIRSYIDNNGDVLCIAMDIEKK